MATVTIARPMAAHASVRFNHRQAAEDLEGRRAEARNKKDTMQADWDAKVISYEELLPKTQAPTPVRTRRLTPRHVY